MTIFDLLFILVFFATLGSLVRSLYLALRGRRPDAWRTLKRLGAFLGAYLAVVILVSLATPRRVLAMREDQCFDDWCLAVDGVTVTKTLGAGAGATRAEGAFYIVRLRVSSRARRVTQREKGVSVHLLDDGGNACDPSPLGQRAYETVYGASQPLSVAVGPGSAFTAVRVFDCPENSRGLGLVVSHGAGPGWFIIGDSGSLLHRRTVVKLDVTAAR
jgi:hypothetical protein